MFDKQVIISIGREFGSGGHQIAREIAKRLDLPYYDSNLLEEIARKKGFNSNDWEEHDERPRTPILTRTVRGRSSSFNENMAMMQFDFLREKASNGESFVIVGRCSESILKEYDALISFFILADVDKRIENVAKTNNLPLNKAKSLVNSQDRKRKAYHNYYCDGKWGDARFYDLTINSGKLDFEEVVDLILDYIKIRTK
ncbi:hypothetical protein P261_02825 [Lachnospiraceae bacterium TWA4]|nr:hypothetical protein P261_02825 [Lachnospiraceae bacterium TWA4]